MNIHAIFIVKDPNVANSFRLTFFTNMLLSLQTRPLTITFFHVNKRYRIPKGQSKMDNPEKLATQVT